MTIMEAQSEAFQYRPLISTARKSPDTSGTHPTNRSAFPFKYSPDTERLIKELGCESRLTFTQKEGFQSILRKGEPLPIRPCDIYQQELFRHRHAEKARAAGIPVLPTLDLKLKSHTLVGLRNGKRRLEQIKKTIQADPLNENGRRSYIGIDKEKEKDRLAHRMATGKDPPVEGLGVQGISKGKVSQNEHDVMDPSLRFLELIEEIQDRLTFLDQMDHLGSKAEYKATISTQIQSLVQQMRNINPSKATEFSNLLKLDRFTNMERHKPSQIQDIIFSNE